MLKNTYDDVHGWLSLNEMSFLKTFPKENGCHDILELGSWVGKSTLCLSENVTSVTTVDIFPQLTNFELNDKNEYFFKIGQFKSPVDVITKEKFESEIRPIIINGVRKQLENNLVKYNRKNVNVVSGNFHDITLEKTFKFIFADCCHSICEIDYNMSKILSFLDLNGFLSIHDQTDSLKRHICNKYNMRSSVSVDSIVVYERSF